MDAAQPENKVTARNRNDRPIFDRGVENVQRLAVGLDAEDGNEDGPIGEIEVRVARGQSALGPPDLARRRQLDDLEQATLRILHRVETVSIRAKRRGVDIPVMAFDDADDRRLHGRDPE